VSAAPYTGGCLCGQLRYVAAGEPKLSGHCYCSDCRKSSGSGFIPFMGFPASHVTITGHCAQHRTTSFRGSEAVRNYCPDCGGLVFGGQIGVANEHTIYAGSLDDAARFKPQVAIFMRDRVAWALVPEGVTPFDTLPDRPPG
jgi:hypothetical protein